MASTRLNKPWEASFEKLRPQLHRWSHPGQAILGNPGKGICVPQFYSWPLKESLCRARLGNLYPCSMSESPWGAMCGNYTPSSKTSFFRVEQIIGCQTNKTVSPLPWLLCVSSFTTVLHRVFRVREALSTLSYLASPGPARQGKLCPLSLGCPRQC